MKIACDRCEKVVVFGSEEYEERWRAVEIYKAGAAPSPANRMMPSINSLILCDGCYDRLMDFMQGEKKANP